METFKELGLSENLIAVLEKHKILEPTEIQKRAIPFVLEGRDVVGISSTGSGKTLAFSAGILENLESNGFPQALILTPTRELAEQIASAVRSFALKQIKVFAAYGGVDIKEHMNKIREADIIVATPGRLLDLLTRGAFSLKEIKTLVLDEFDRMLDMGFQKELHPIIMKCPPKRQTMLFSATKSGRIEELIEEYTKNAVEVSVKAFVDHSKLEQLYYPVKNKDKFSLLVHMLRMDKSSSVIVFCSTKINTDFVSQNLDDFGLDTLIIHGGLDQKNRTKTLKKFHKEGGILVCTDVAARGLDIKNVNKVYNYDMPRKPEDYIHRIGRTARAGKKGQAITIVSGKDENMFKRIMKIEGVEMTEMDTPDVQKVLMKTIKIRKEKNKEDKPKKKPSSSGWTSINDADLSNRFKKRTVARHIKEGEEKEEGRPSKNKSRTNGSKRKKRGSGPSKSKTSRHIPSKGKKVSRGRAGTRKTGKKINNRPKGRANRKTRK